MRSNYRLSQRQTDCRIQLAAFFGTCGAILMTVATLYVLHMVYVAAVWAVRNGR